MTTDTRLQKAHLRATCMLNVIVLGSAVVIFLFITIMIIRVVPINADETFQYHVIACDFYANAKYHTFWTPCDGSMNLNLLGVHLKRAYFYTGAFSSYFYYPFFRLFPSILTQRLIGVFFLTIFVAVLMLLEEKNKISVIVIFALSFPIIYQLVNDTGPVRYSIFMIAFTPLFVKFIIHTKQPYIKTPLNIVLGSLLFLAVEDKPFFLYFTPSIILLTIAYNHGEKDANKIIDSIRLLLREIWISVMVFVSFTILYLLVAKTSSGQIHLVALMGAKEMKPQKPTEALISLLSFMADFQKFSHMVYNTNKFRLLNVSFSLLIWCYGFIFIAKTCKRGPSFLPPLKIVFTLLSLIASIVVLLFMRNAWAGHHFIYPYTFAMLAVCQSTSHVIERKNKFLILYSFFSILLASQLLFFVPNPRSSWERYKIFEYLKQETIAKDYIIAHLSLGTYYISSLYGHKEQLAIQIRLDRKTAMEVINLSNKVKRKILCICRGPDCNSEDLSNSFQKQIEFEEVSLSNNDWKIYRERNRI